MGFPFPFLLLSSPILSHSLLFSCSQFEHFPCFSSMLLFEPSPTPVENLICTYLGRHNKNPNGCPCMPCLDATCRCQALCCILQCQRGTSCWEIALKGICSRIAELCRGNEYKVGFIAFARETCCNFKRRRKRHIFPVRKLHKDL